MACLSPQPARAEGYYEQLQIQAPEAVDMIISIREGAAEGRPLPYSYPHVDGLGRLYLELPSARAGCGLRQAPPFPNEGG